MKSAVITGITGQDGAYLAELLLDKGYSVYGTYRNAGMSNFWRLEELGIEKHDNLHLLEYDLTDPEASIRLLESTGPSEVYNLAAHSSSVSSHDMPVLTAQVNGFAVLNLLEAIRIVDPSIHFFQASSSELFGNASETPQVESTPFSPRSPYGVAKLFAHWLTVNYRENYGIFACSGILFNHESPLRGIEFVTRKITDSMAKILLGKMEVLELGNIDSRRDWGYAREYVDAMWRMLQAGQSDSYVLATNRMETVRDFVSLSGKAAGFDLVWEGNAESEIAVDRMSGKTIVRINPQFYRPSEINLRIGSPEKAKLELGWEPKITLANLCQMMVEADIRRNTNS